MKWEYISCMILKFKREYWLIVYETGEVLMDEEKDACERLKKMMLNENGI